MTAGSSLKLTADGWINAIRHLPSSHHTARPAAAKIVLVVIHGISLPPRQFGGEAVAHLFCGTLDCDEHPYFAKLRGLRVSAHFFIRRDGELTQFVSTEAAAWHAGDSLWRGKKNCNDFSIGIELEGCDDIPYTKAQYQQLTRLLKTLIGYYPHLRIAGHCHIASARKTDPGDAFDWQALFTAIGNRYDGRDTA